MVKSSAFGGLVLALAGIAVGLYLDGGHFTQLLQPTAGLIVFGGTFGAVLVQFPLPIVWRAAAQLKPIFLGQDDPTLQRMNDISRFASLARRNGMLSLEMELDGMDDPFFRLCVQLTIDGVNVELLRSLAESAMQTEISTDASLAKVFESAGGFAPTVGILGAVIGLIQVMQRMENISEVGRGIAVAFVATIYGVGLANLFLLPCAGRVRLVMGKRQTLRELTVEGVVGIAEGLSPRAIEQRLTPFIHVTEPTGSQPLPLTAK